MQALWFADPTDLIKRALLAHLSDKNRLKTIIQVLYLRDTEPLYFVLDGERIRVPDAVWNLLRNVSLVETLDLKAKVKVLREPLFDPAKRDAYSACVSGVLRDSEHPLLLFLDPDTGLEPSGMATEKHVTKGEVARAWSELQPHDWLVLYQHARREAGWTSAVSEQMSELGDGARVKIARSEQVGKDVAFLCVEK